MTMPTSAELVPTARPGGLLSVARPAPAGWQRGVDVVFGAFLPPDRVHPCPTSPTSPGEPGSPGEVARFVPVGIQQGIECTALGRPNVTGLVRTAADLSIGYALSLELYDGAGTGNPSLADAVSLGSGLTVQDAVGQLEQAAEDQTFGRLAVIHVPVGLSVYFGDLLRDGEAWRTRAGNLIAIHGTGNVVYATGEIWASWERVADGSRSYIDPRTNRAEGWADTLGIVIFDPAFIASVTVGP